MSYVLRRCGYIYLNIEIRTYVPNAVLIKKMVVPFWFDFFCASVEFAIDGWMRLVLGF